MKKSHSLTHARVGNCPQREIPLSVVRNGTILPVLRTVDGATQTCQVRSTSNNKESKNRDSQTP